MDVLGSFAVLIGFFALNALPFMLIPVGAWWVWLRHRKAGDAGKPGQCARCGYQRGINGVARCPECGQETVGTLPADAPQSRWVSLGWVLAAFAATVLIPAGECALLPALMPRGLAVYVLAVVGELAVGGHGVWIIEICWKIRPRERRDWVVHRLLLLAASEGVCVFGYGLAIAYGNGLDSVN